MTAQRTRSLRLAGELTIITAADQKRRLDDFLAKESDGVVDLARVTELDTAGLQLLLLARREAQSGGYRLTFRAPSGPVRDALAIVHLDEQVTPGGREP